MKERLNIEEKQNKELLTKLEDKNKEIKIFHDKFGVMQAQMQVLKESREKDLILL